MLKNAKALTVEEQKQITGGMRVCGGTGGIVINLPEHYCFGWGIVWHNGRCWACY